MTRDQLNAAFQEAYLRLERIVAATVGAIWTTLPHYNRVEAEQFVTRILPIIHGAQVQSAALTNAYLSQYLGIPPTAIDPVSVTGAAVRPEHLAPNVVYTEPFYHVWKNLSEGQPWAEAVKVGESQAKGNASMDVSLAMRATSDVVALRARQSDQPQIMGWHRVAHAGACAWCMNLNGAYVKSGNAMEIHRFCRCSLAPNVVWPKNASYTPFGERITPEMRAQAYDAAVQGGFVEPGHAYDLPQAA